MSSTMRRDDGTKPCDSCGALVLWAVSDKSGRAIPLNPSPVEPETHPRAFVLIGGRAYAAGAAGREAAVTRIATMHHVSEADAAAILADQYRGAHHDTHFATCPAADQHRRRRPTNPARTP